MRIALLTLSTLLLACGGEPVKLAEQAEKLTIEAPKSQGARRFVVDATSGELGFDMDAPIEKIRGRVPASALSGEIFVDPSDLTKATGLVHVDLRELELFQRKADEEGKPFGEETKNDTQNQHARGIGIQPMGERRRSRQAEAQVVEAFLEIGRTAGAGMHGKPGRLVDHQDQTIAMQHSCLDFLGCERRRATPRRRRLQSRAGHRSSHLSLAS